MGKNVAKIVLSTGLQGRRGRVCAGLPRWPLSWGVFQQMAAAEQRSPALLSVCCLCSFIQINSFLFANLELCYKKLMFVLVLQDTLPPLSSVT